MAAGDLENFLGRTREARKVMVLDLGFLGDTVHLLPALWLIRQGYPQAQLHVSTAAHVVSLFECIPWVNKVWGYPRFPKKATLRQSVTLVRELRREKYDVLINLNGSDRSSWLSFFSGARERLGRKPGNGGSFLWKRMFTASVEYPFRMEPVYLQRCRCLERAGFPAVAPEFRTEITVTHLESAGISPEVAGTYVHLSPFTTSDKRELPPEQMVRLISALGTLFPGRRLVLSCAPTPRERTKMASLLALLPAKPWRVFDGNLNLTQLAALIRYSLLHLSGDTGTIHLAVMTNTPSVSWFVASHPGLKEWMPAGERHRSVLGHNTLGEAYLQGVALPDLVAELQSAHAAGAHSELKVSS